MSKINYSNKSYLNQNANVPSANKVEDTDMNSIKNAINEEGAFTTCTYSNSKYSCTLEGTLQEDDIVCLHIPLSSQNGVDSDIQISVDNGTTYNYIKDSTETFNIKASYLNYKDVDLILKYTNSYFLVVAPNIEIGSMTTFTRTTNQALTSGTFTKILYDTTTTKGIKIASISTGTITFEQTGTYMIIVNTTYDANATGGRYQDVYIGALSGALASGSGITGVRTSLNSVWVEEHSVGETLYARGYQNSGGNLNIIANSTFLTIVKIK